MPVQYLYPNRDIAHSIHYPMADETDYPWDSYTYTSRILNRGLDDSITVFSYNGWAKSTPSASGHYTYIDEGVSTANDNDYIQISGYFSSGTINYLAGGLQQKVNPFNRHYTTFALSNLEVIPSSIQFNFRGNLVPGNSFPVTTPASGAMNVWAVLHTSGFTTYHNNSIGFGGLNYDTIIASSHFMVYSGGFTTYSTNMILNDTGVRSINKYNKAYITLGVYQEEPASNWGSPYSNTQFKISAMEAIVSGEYLQGKGLPLHITGGDDYNLDSQRLLIYNKHAGTEHTDDIREFHKLLARTNDLVSTQYGLQGNAINMCLNSGSIQRKHMFSDCFFEFEKIHSISEPLNRVEIVYSSITSHHRMAFRDYNGSHIGQLNLPDYYQETKHQTHIGTSKGYPGWNYGVNRDSHSSDDSSVALETSLYGQAYYDDGSFTLGCIPSGDFSVWLGVDGVPYPRNFTNRTNFLYGGGLVFGRDGDSRLYAALTGTNGTNYIYTTIDMNNMFFKGFVFTYNSGGFAFWRMNIDGEMEKIGQTSPFTRVANPTSSSIIIINQEAVHYEDPNQDVGLHASYHSPNHYTLYELGISSSGFIDQDVARLDRQDLFRKIDGNLDTQPLTSGHNHLLYESFQGRHNGAIGVEIGVNDDIFLPYGFSGFSYRYGSDRKIGDDVNGYNSRHRYFDTDYNDLRVTLQGQYIEHLSQFYPDIETINYNYVDILRNFHVSGNTSNYFQDGDVYFSGWIDCSTTNPSGLVNDNVFINIFNDKSVVSYGNFLVQNVNSGIGINYTQKLQARGKSAGAVFTLRSGLNHYVIPLQEEIFYHDVYCWNSVQDSQAYPVYHNKRNFSHPSWDGADIGLWYLGRDDPYDSGWVDTIRIHSAAIINDCWLGPAPSISTGLPLYVAGIGTYSSGLDLYLNNNYRMSGMDLFCYNPLNPSGNTAVTLYTLNGPAPWEAAMTLYINGPAPLTSGTPLYICGPLPASGYFPLYINSAAPPVLESGISLFTFSTLNSSVIRGMDLYTNSVGVGHGIPLFTQVRESADWSGYIPLFVASEGEKSNGLNLFLYNTTEAHASSVRLTIRGAGGLDGGYVYNSGHTLYIRAGDGQEGSNSDVPLFLQVPEGSTSGMDMYIYGGTFVTNALDLSIATTLGLYSGNITMYSHGF